MHSVADLSRPLQWAPHRARAVRPARAIAGRTRLLAPVLLAVALSWPALAAGGDLAAQETGEATVRVVNSDGEPVEADVRLVGYGPIHHLNADETARFSNVPAGEYLIEVTTVFGDRGISRVVIRSGETAEVDVEVTRLYRGQEIVAIVGGGSARTDLLSPVNVVEGAYLRSGAEPSLGEALTGEPGINSTFHGPGSSRPIVRGLGGNRVRVLESGVGTGDASSTSPDHAPAVEVALADQIEILRGPATLLYTSSASGGVINVEDGRIPRQTPPSLMEGLLSARWSSATGERNLAGHVDGGRGSLSYHLGGLYRKTDDYSIPGHPDASHEPTDPHEGHEDEPDEHEGVEAEGILPNSAMETSRLVAGLSYVHPAGFFGVSVSGYDSEYGIPGGHLHPAQLDDGEAGPDGHDPEDEEAEDSDVAVDLTQRRLDLEGAWRFGGSFARRVRARFGVADYEHFEMVDEPREGVNEFEAERFNNEWEGRLELEHAFGERGSGFVGLQARKRDFEAFGIEALTPPTTTSQIAAFLYETIDLSPAFRLEAGGRLEAQTASTPALERSHTAASTSLGAVIHASEAVEVLFSGSRSVKLPVAEELFTEGPHLATLTFEVGNPDLEAEIAYSLEGGIRLGADRVRGSINVFSNSFDNFVYQRVSGAERSGLPELIWSQAGARFTGFETEMEFHLRHGAEPGYHVTLDALLDYVRAELSETGDPLPRIPPLRFGLGLNYETPRFRARLDARRTTAQERVAEFEDPTPGYTLVNARLHYTIEHGRFIHGIVLSGLNLTNAEARSHTSFLKDLAPLPGRNIRLFYQLGF
ncbi:TonB-dependent receptor [Candidatus Palauibacter sp.]|uniref:TonB-dependent receptor n=1 Tax=Candidatus Palauibacter sp. TaxID=3101350 RepID=UPI003B01BC78